AADREGAARRSSGADDVCRQRGRDERSRGQPQAGEEQGFGPDRRCGRAGNGLRGRAGSGRRAARLRTADYLKEAAMQNRAYSVLEVKSVDEGRRVIRGIATTPTVDRVGDIIDPMGVKFQ